MTDPSPSYTDCSSASTGEIDGNLDYTMKVAKTCPAYCSKFEAQMLTPRNLKKRVLARFENTPNASIYMQLPAQTERMESLEGLTFLGNYLRKTGGLGQGTFLVCFLFRYLGKYWWQFRAMAWIICCSLGNNA